jgi:hypothetical protein
MKTRQSVAQVSRLLFSRLLARPSDDNLSPCAVKSSYWSRVSLRPHSCVLTHASPIAASMQSFSPRLPFSLRLHQDFRLAYSILQGRGRARAFYLDNNLSTFNTSSSRVLHSSGTWTRLSMTFELTAEPFGPFSGVARHLVLLSEYLLGAYIIQAVC